MTQMTEDNGTKDVWVQRARAISIVGATAVIALYLVYFVTRVQDAKMDKALERGADTLQILDSHGKESSTYNQSFKELLYRICYNTATTEEEKKQCARAY